VRSQSAAVEGDLAGRIQQLPAASLDKDSSGRAAGDRMAGRRSGISVPQCTLSSEIGTRRQGSSEKRHVAINMHWPPSIALWHGTWQSKNMRCKPHGWESGKIDVGAGEQAPVRS
jgi:hypothetical protein